MASIIDELMGVYETILDKDDKEDEVDTNIPVTTTEGMEIIKSMIKKLYDQIDFMKEELKEKNLLIKMLMYRNANDGDLIDINLVDENHILQSMESTSSTTSSTTKTSSTEIREFTNIVDYEDTAEENESLFCVSKNKGESMETQIKNYQAKHKENFNAISETTAISYLNTTNTESISGYEAMSTNTENSFLNSTSVINVANVVNIEHGINDRYEWQKSSSGVASRIMGNMGYQGKGLGKKEDGRTDTIAVEPAGLGVREIRKRKLLYILSSSMLNRMEADRLCSQDVQVKVQCHGGCTIRCLYSHLPNVIKHKPDYILLHIGSNDCTTKTSDDVLNELKKLIDHLKILLPCSVVILSSPVVRADNTTAAAVQKNLNIKTRKLFYPFLDNSNIGYDHLGKKGLHLNDHGTKLMARNIISLVKRL